MATTGSPLSCPACRVIDQADGVEDGKLYKVDHYGTRSELDFETNIRSEIWSVHIGQALGVDPAHVEDVVRQAITGSRTQLDNPP